MIMTCKNIMANFRLTPEEFEGIKILATVKGVTLVDYVREMFDEEIARHKDIIAEYKNGVEELRCRMK